MPLMPVRGTAKQSPWRRGVGSSASGDEQLGSVKSIIVPSEGVVVGEAPPSKSVVTAAEAMGAAEVRTAVREMGYISEDIPRRAERSLGRHGMMRGCGVCNRRDSNVRRMLLD